MSDERAKRALRAEAMLLRVPVFALAVKGSAALDGFEYRHARRRLSGAAEVVVRTERGGDAPYPGPLSRRVHMAVLSLVGDRGFPFENPVCWTWRDLCRRMGLPNSGRRVGELKGAIQATLGLRLFGLLARDGGQRVPWRSLYDACEFQNESRPDGKVAAANRLWLSSWYLESLNALHSAPIDYELWKRLEKVGPLASRLYEYLLPPFYKREAFQVSYDRLATAMPVVVEARRSHAHRQFAPALAALRTEGVLAESEWSEMKGTGRPKLILTRGSRLAPDRDRATPEDRDRGAPLVLSTTIEAVEALANDFYRLLGRDHRPLRSDLAVARALIARYGLDEARGRLPDAVKRLKARFRNAETMGALVRYFDESAREAARLREDQARLDREAAGRLAERSRQERDDASRRAAWDALPEAERAARRAALLVDHPTLGRFPALLDAACLQSLPLDQGDASAPLATRQAP